MGEQRPSDDDVTTQSISPGRLQMAMRLELAQDAAQGDLATEVLLV